VHQVRGLLPGGGRGPGGPCSPSATTSAAGTRPPTPAELPAPHRDLSVAVAEHQETRIRQQNPRANDRRLRATPGHSQPRSPQLDGTSGHFQPPPDTLQTLPTSEGALVRTQLRPPGFLQLAGLFETLIGNPVTTAGNHRCMLPDGGRVPSGQGSIPFDHQGAPCASRGLRDEVHGPRGPPGRFRSRRYRYAAGSLDRQPYASHLCPHRIRSPGEYPKAVKKSSADCIRDRGSSVPRLHPGACG
jgi:hypothetical protein